MSDEEFKNIINSSFKEKYSGLFEGMDELDNIAGFLSEIVYDDGLWSEISNSIQDRVEFIAMIGSLFMQVLDISKPLYEEIYKEEDERYWNGCWLQNHPNKPRWTMSVMCMRGQSNMDMTGLSFLAW